MAGIQGIGSVHPLCRSVRIILLTAKLARQSFLPLLLIGFALPLIENNSSERVTCASCIGIYEYPKVFSWAGRQAIR